MTETTTTANNSSQQPIRVPGRVVAYTLIFAGLAGVAFAILLARLPNLSGEAPGTDLTRVFVMTMAAMFAAGALGGSLYNLRGLIKHSAEEDYLEAYNLSYYLRPVSGGISGLLVFFLLMGGIMSFTAGTSQAIPSWITFQGRMPYLAFGILSGYGSHEFMLKLKDVAESLFTIRKPK